MTRQTHLHDATNSIIEIPQVEVELTGWHSPLTAFVSKTVFADVMYTLHTVDSCTRYLLSYLAVCWVSAQET